MVAPVIYETPKSRKFRQDAASAAMPREWFVGGTTDPLEVRDLLLANNPLSFLGLSRKSVEASSLGAPDLWFGVVEYGVSAILDGLKPDELSFKVGSQSVHITQGKETMFRRVAADNGTAAPAEPDPNDYPLGALDPGYVAALTVYDEAFPLYQGTAADTQGAIGVTLDAVQGCDILVPKMEFSLARQRASVDFPYVRTLRNMVGKTNDREFYGFPAGTLLYLGCEPTSAMGTLDSGDKFFFWNLAHSFAQEETKLNQMVGGILVPRKRGFEYVWARYNPVVGGANPQLAMRPEAVYVERVYDAANFELLEIGS